MTTVAHSNELGARKSRARVSGFPKTSVAFDWVVAILSFATIVGAFIDGWAHNTFPENIETFLTPWHAMLYGGVLATGTALGIAYLRNLSKGYGLWRSLPQGYLLSFIGFAIFGMSGGFDFLWHSIFGFEVDAEALLSPAHLSLAVGAVLMVSGPFRSAWIASGADEHRGWRLAPAIVSLLSLISITTFFTMYANVITHAHNMIGDQTPYAAGRSGDAFAWQTATISYMLIPSIIIMFFLLLAVRRWKLPMGTFTALITLNAVMMFALSIEYNGFMWPVLVATLVAGIVADVLYAMLKPSVSNLRGMRFFAALVPLLYNVFIIVAMLVSYGMWWTVHMWGGVPFITGAIGLALSMLVAPPAIPSEAEA